MDLSTPDVQPGNFGVTLAPSHGSTYLGMTARDDFTWEDVHTSLITPLSMDSCYLIQIDLAFQEYVATYWMSPISFFQVKSLTAHYPYHYTLLEFIFEIVGEHLFTVRITLIIHQIHSIIDYVISGKQNEISYSIWQCVQNTVVTILMHLIPSSWQ